MDRIAPKTECTGCSACAYACPKSCIQMVEQGFEGLLPTLNLDGCIDCGRCTNACPIKNPIKKHPQIRVYASWHTDSEMRKNCASSGTASGMYQEALNQGWYIAGAVSVNALDVEMVLSDQSSSIQDFSSSKYIFSNSEKLYPQIKQALANGHKILFIGLPCQVAAISKLFKNKREQMVLVDLVCHGTNAKEYLRQHVAKVESSTQSKVEKVIFREGEKFLLKMLDCNGQEVYSESSWYKDMYLFGYHKGIFYRENCYQCAYAESERVSDITLKDYWGLGERMPVDFPKERVSAALINTERGFSFFEKCIESGFLIAHERPMDEAISGDPQMRHPTLIKPEKLEFDALMKQGCVQFDTAMARIARKDYRKDLWKNRVMRIKNLFYKLRSKVYHSIAYKSK